MSLIKRMKDVSLGCILIVTSSICNAALDDPNADLVYLYKDCTGYSNCTTSVSNLLDWLWNTRNPSSSDPVSVSIGPGRFQMSPLPKFCEDSGFVSFIGSGRENSILIADANSGGSIFGLEINNCTSINFSNLSIEGFGFGITWVGGGTSTYSNVDLIGGMVGWYDDINNGVCADPIHYWFGSRITSTGLYGRSVAYRSHCGEHWIYGSELTAKNSGNQLMNSQGAVAAAKQADIKIFGSAVRSIGGNVNYGSPGLGATGEPTGLTAVASSDGGVVHMHGGIINVTSVSTFDTSVAAIVGDAAGTAHIVDTAFSVNASGNGTPQRILGINALSPFQWPQGISPPIVESINGADTFVETDCSSADCNQLGSEPHLLIYTQSCSSVGALQDPWFDVVTGKCRGGGAP